MIIQVAMLCFFDAPRSWLFGHCLKGNKSLEGLRNTFGVIYFNVTRLVLDIVYSQTLCWLGIFFAPLITIVTMVKLCFMLLLRLFYVKKVMWNKQKLFSSIKILFVLLLPFESVYKQCELDMLIEILIISTGLHKDFRTCDSIKGIRFFSGLFDNCNDFLYWYGDDIHYKCKGISLIVLINITT